MATSINPQGIQRSSPTYSLSEITALLKETFGDRDLTPFFEKLLNKRRPPIQPGDLITAEWATSVDERLDLLSATTGEAKSPTADQLAKTLLDTWNFYSALETRGEFLPETNDNAALLATVRIGGLLRAVWATAAYGAALARNADKSLQLEILRRLYAVQKAMANAFARAIPGAANATRRQIFGTAIKSLLDDGESMKRALDASDPVTARAVQDRINGVLMNQTGEVTTGNLEVVYLRSTRGIGIVTTDTGVFGYVFLVTNKSNRTVSARLEALFEDKPAWSSFASVVTPNSATLNLAPFDEANPTSADAAKEVTVVVRKPTSAVRGDTGRLSLTASVPAPINLGDSDDIELEISDVEIPEAPNLVRFTRDAAVEAGQLGNARRGQGIDLRFYARFTTKETLKTRNFVLRVISDKSLETFLLDSDATIATPTPYQTTVLSQSFPMTDRGTKSVALTLVPQNSTPLGTYSLTISIDAADNAFQCLRPITMSINVVP